MITITNLPIDSTDYTQQFDAYTKFEMLNYFLQGDKEENTLNNEADKLRAEEEMVGEVVDVKGEEDV